MCFSQTSLLLPPSAECVRCDALSGEQVSAQSQPALRSREQIDARSLASPDRTKHRSWGAAAVPPPPLRDATESRRLPGGFSQRDLTQPRSLCAGRSAAEQPGRLPSEDPTRSCSREYRGASPSIRRQNPNFSCFIPPRQLRYNFDPTGVPRTAVRSTWIHGVLVFSPTDAHHLLNKVLSHSSRFSGSQVDAAC